MSFVVGVDVATADVRALAVAPDGRVLAAAGRRLPAPVQPQAGWSEQPAGHAEAVLAVLAALARELPPGRPEALSVTTTSGTVLPVDGRMAPLGPALLYDDRRAWQDGATPPVLAAAPALARIGWLARHTGAHRFAHVSDVVLARLAGRPVPTDTSAALKTGADPATCCWDEELLAAAGVRVDQLPPVAPPLSPAGSLSPAAAAATGLPRGLPLVLGMTDGCTGQVAAGAVREGDRAAVLGTTLVLKTVAARQVVDDALGVYSHRAPDGLWWAGGASNAGAGALDGGSEGLAALDRRAVEHGPATAMAYPVSRPGERFPFVATAAGGLLSEGPRSPAERHRMLLEGVAFVERLGFEVLAASGAPGAGPVHAVGGGSRSDVWLRIRASTLGVPFEVPAQPSSGFGAAVLAAAATLHPGLGGAVEAMVRLDRRVDPDPAEQAALDRTYHRFLSALRARGWLSATPEGDQR